MTKPPLPIQPDLIERVKRAIIKSDANYCNIEAVEISEFGSAMYDRHARAALEAAGVATLQAQVAAMDIQRNDLAAHALALQAQLERVTGERDAARELLVIAAKRQAADDERIRELEGQLRKALAAPQGGV